MSYRLFVTLVALILLLVGCSPARKAPVRSLSHQKTTQAEVAMPTYEVKQGDTLYSIAFRYGLNYRGLAAKNGISSPYRISIGQRLILSDEVPAYSEVIQPNRQTTNQPTSQSNIDKPAANKPAETPSQTAKKPVSKPRTNQPVASRSKPSDFDRNIRVKQWMWPLKGNRNFKKRPGNQLFFKVKAGTDVHAVAAGRVVYSGKGLVGYGHLVIIKHNQNLLSAYAFNDKVLVKEKENVKAGQKISTVGTSPTGEVGLVLEIRSRGQPVNPLKYLK